RLARERNDIAAGLALSLVYLKPNTALLIPFALLVAGRYRAFAAWALAGTVLALAALLSMGPDGVAAYIAQLRGQLPEGASNLTVEGAFGVSGTVATALRVIIAVATLATAHRFRRSPGLAIAAGAVGSLLVVPYLHGSDLCLFGAAAWIVWEERPALAWRLPIADRPPLACSLDQGAKIGARRGQGGPQDSPAAAAPRLIQPDDDGVRVFSSLDRLDDDLGPVDLDHRSPLAWREPAPHHPKGMVQVLRCRDHAGLPEVSWMRHQGVGEAMLAPVCGRIGVGGRPEQ